MVAYHTWLDEKRRIAFANFFRQHGFYPTWPPIDTIKPGKYDSATMFEESKPFDRRRIIFSTLSQSERTLELYTLMLAEEHPAKNHQHFLDWMDYANDRYARALSLMGKLPAASPQPGQMDLF